MYHRLGDPTVNELTMEMNGSHGGAKELQSFSKLDPEAKEFVPQESTSDIIPRSNQFGVGPPLPDPCRLPSNKPLQISSSFSPKILRVVKQGAKFDATRCKCKSILTDLTFSQLRPGLGTPVTSLCMLETVQQSAPWHSSMQPRVIIQESAWNSEERVPSPQCQQQALPQERIPDVGTDRLNGTEGSVGTVRRSSEPNDTVLSQDRIPDVRTGRRNGTERNIGTGSRSNEPADTILHPERIQDVGTERRNGTEQNVGTRLQWSTPGDTVLSPRQISESSEPVSLSMCRETVITKQPRVTIQKNIVQSPINVVKRDGSIFNWMASFFADSQSSRIVDL